MSDPVPLPAVLNGDPPTVQPVHWAPPRPVRDAALLMWLSGPAVLVLWFIWFVAAAVSDSVAGGNSAAGTMWMAKLGLGVCVVCSVAAVGLPRRQGWAVALAYVVGAAMAALTVILAFTAPLGFAPSLALPVAAVLSLRRPEARRWFAASQGVS